MPSKDQTLQQIADLNTKVDEQEARGTAMIAAKDTTIAELNALITELQARPEVPEDVTASLTTLAENLENNFVIAQEPPAPEG